MADNNKIREEVKALTERLETGIQDLYSSDRYAAYLDTLARFHNYSTRNTMLIHLQMPEATQVAGFNKWKNEFERHVMKGQKGIRIFAPSPYVIKQEMEKLDPETQAPLLDKNGKPVVEEVDVTIPAFKPVSVFDVSQTDGKPLPTLSEDLTGDVQQYEAFLDALRDVSVMPIGFEPLSPDTDGECRFDSRSIAIREGMSEVQTVSAILHEMTHAEIHDYNLQLEQQEQAVMAGPARQDAQETALKPRPRRAEEVEAESVSYVVCQHYGIETGDNSFGYVAAWSKGKELDELKASLDIIRKTAASMIERIDGRFAEICKERGIDLSPVQDAPEQADIAAPELEKPVPATEDSRNEQTLPEEIELEAELASDILPDNSIGFSERDLYGYTDPAILPMLQDRALELYDQDHTVYLLYPDGTEAMAFDRDEIETHDGIFGIEAEEWQASKDYELAKAALQENQADSPDGRDATYAIYQLKDGDETRDYRWEALESLEARGLAVNHENYNLVYTAPLTSTDTLEGIYNKFNIDRPDDFTGHSLSMSDVIVIQQDGNSTAHYIDRADIKELPDFFKEVTQPEIAATEVERWENDHIADISVSMPPVPTVADMEAQVKAGQQISLLDLARAVKHEQQGAKDKPAQSTRTKAEKPSILAQLQEAKKAAAQEREQPKNAPKRDSEREV